MISWIKLHQPYRLASHIQRVLWKERVVTAEVLFGEEPAHGTLNHGDLFVVTELVLPKLGWSGSAAFVSGDYWLFVVTDSGASGWLPVTQEQFDGTGAIEEVNDGP